MNVTISVGGKFHAFHLAKQLQAKGYLDRIFTSYPWFKAKESGLLRQKVDSLILKEILEYGFYKIPYLSRKLDIPYHAANLFDEQVASRIKPCDIFVGWSGFSLYTLRKVKKTFSAKVILEHSCVYLETEQDILIEEQKKFGARASLLCPSFIKKGLQEFKEADCIVVPSRFARHTFLDRGFCQEKIICVPLGTDIDTFRPMPKNDRSFRIICIGISMRKGTHYLLQAISELKIKDIEVWLIGRIDNDIKFCLKKYAGRFKYLGRMPQKELYKYYTQSSISVLFSVVDGFGLVLLEAMACGLAVICSDSTGAKDTVRNNIDGFIVPTRDVETLKEKIVYLYENRNICQEMGRQARENVTENFTWDRYGERIVNAYLNLLK